MVLSTSVVQWDIERDASDAPKLTPASVYSESSVSTRSLSERGAESLPLVETDRELPAHHPTISWGSLGVRLYGVMPGDHPDCVQGPPVRVRLCASAC